MSGRPTSPFISYTAPTWATGGNYPAGAEAWASTPLKTAPPASYFTPALPGAAQYFNYLFNAQGAALGASQTWQGDAINWTGQGPAQNWKLNNTQPLTYSGTIGTVVAFRYGYTRAAYCRFRRLWLLTAQVAGVANADILHRTPDDGTTWVAMPSGDTIKTSGSGVGPFRVFGLATRPSDGKIVAQTDGNPIVGASVAVNGSWTAGNCIYFDVASKWVLIGLDSGGTQTLNYSSNASAFTACTLSGLSGVFTGCTDVFIAQSPTTCVALCNVAGTTKAAQSTDGVTFTGRTVTGLGGSYVVKGLGYGGGLFVLGASNGTDSKIITSPDGITWTVAATLTGHVVAGLNSAGALHFATSTFDGLERCIYSVDGGVTWQTGSSFHLPADDAGIVPVYSNGNQFFATTNTHLSVSSGAGAGY